MFPSIKCKKHLMYSGMIARGARGRRSSNSRAVAEAAALAGPATPRRHRPL